MHVDWGDKRNVINRWDSIAAHREIYPECRSRLVGCYSEMPGSSAGDIAHAIDANFATDLDDRASNYEHKGEAKKDSSDKF